MRPMTTTQITEFPCPVQGCLVFPFDNAQDLADHVESGDHVLSVRRGVPAQAEAPRRFETVGNGFGGTTTRKAAEVVAPTEKQKAFLRSLLSERTGIEAAEVVRANLNEARENGTLSRKLVSSAIDALLKIERTPVDRPAPEAPAAFDPSKGSLDPETLRAIPAGRYLVDDTFLQVDRPEKGRWDGFIFVKVIVNQGGEFTDTRRAAILNPKSSAARVDEKYRLAVETLASDPKAAAVAFGMNTGRCCICGRTLTDPSSIEAGIGPVCASRF